MNKHLCLLWSLAITTTAWLHAMPSRSHEDADASRERLSKTVTFEVSYQIVVSGDRVEGSVVVPGTVALEADPHRFERWPRVLSDVRGLKCNAGGSPRLREER